MQLVVPTEGPRHVRVLMRYGVVDPCAVRLRLPGPPGVGVTWVFSRDLMLQGLGAPTGDGDVRIWPFGGDSVRISLTSPDGEVLLQAAACHLSEFLDRSFSLCSADRLLIVEDDAKLVSALQRGLSLEGYVVDVARTGDDGLLQATAEDYAVVVLDLMLPGIDGFTVCEELRRRERWMPVLMLTARADASDRIRGLDGGADDYMVKPFDFGELLARLRVLTRRGPSAHPRVFDVGDLRVDASTRVVTRSGHQVELTAREFDVLEVLARTPGQLVSRAQLLQAVWTDGYQGSPNIVDVYIGYLRKKLERRRGRRLIRTVRGKGFLLESP